MKATVDAKDTKCPICLKERQLVKHHWWEDRAHTIGHIRLICSRCNGILRTLKDEDNHILPDWDKQIAYVRNYTSNEIPILGLTCPRCNSIKLVKNGMAFRKKETGIIEEAQRYLCTECGLNTINPKSTQPNELINQKGEEDGTPN
jgi:transposase-like protein